MSRMKCRLIIIILLLFIYDSHSQSTGLVGIGTIQQNVPWRAGHASVFEYPYVIIYGGSDDPTANMSSTQLKGSTGLWIWDSRNGSWYNPIVQVQGGAIMLPQVYFKATNLPSQGQIVAIVSNTTNGLATGVIQKLDINSWSWSFPTSNFQASAKTIGYTMETVNNTIYTYGGLSVDGNGFPQSNAVQNTLSLIDTNSFSISPGSNGLGLTDHTTCYLPKCNCLVTFGGTSTGNPTEVTDAVNIYDLNLKVWNVQGIQTTPGSATPGARRLHTANCLNDQMIIYGGGTNQPADTDVWVLNATSYPNNLSWQRINVANQTQGPNLRMGHSSVYDDTTNKLYIYGGWGVSATNDSNMYVLDVANWSWTRVATTGYPQNELPSTNSTGANNDNNNNNNTITNLANKMSAGAIAGVAVGAALGLLALLTAIIFFFIRKKHRQNNKDSVIDEDVSENIQHHELKPQTQQHDNPYYYNSGGFYSTNDDSDNNQGYYNTSTPRTNKRVSKAWTGTMSTRRSEIGDSDKVVTGVLEAMNNHDEGTVAATHGSRSPRESLRNSKVLLVTPITDYVGQGQVPNEIISQKPNEFSAPVSRFHYQQQNIPIDHHQHDTNSVALSENCVPLSSSMEVLRSVKTNASSMMNHPGSQFSGIKRSGGVVPVTHATADTTTPLEDDTWTFTDSLSVNHHHHNENTRPIQYILPNSSHQLSTATSTQTWDTKNQQNSLVVHHHQQQYPSSTINMPLAETVTPPTTTNNSSSNTTELRNENNSPVNIYNTISPLDVLASLGRDQQNITPGSSRNGSYIVRDSGKEIATTTDEQFIQLAPLINALPRRYQLDKSKKPITGPANNVLFVTNNDQKHIAIKAFGRREAWERECRTLIKLKSSCVVEILEVLTIQSDHQTSNNQEEVDGEIKYVTVMERLDETLGTFIRNKRNNTTNGITARDVLACLSWCHSNGIAFCDLKPSNIMHNQGEPWKLIDFEASRTMNEECVGVITPRYCPPEVARATTYGLEGANGVVATASVDLWSLGCVIYELETKKALFPSNITDETILHFISHPSPSTPILNNGLRWNENKELEIPQLERLVPNSHTRQLIKTLLSKDPSKRGSAPQLLEDPYFA